MTFHEVNTRIDQPMEHDIHRGRFAQILFKVSGPKIKDNKYIIDFSEEICCFKKNEWYMHLLQCYTTVENFRFFKNVEGQYRFNRKKKHWKSIVVVS